ncbi:hypothetical protein [Arthrobacter mangrovi]|uniref:hypothetical protein n=1 Tax=Arthrobacter mangrovi TaxID=2966350 RepID=UPI0022309A62|nr:hypothetical protein [Arthrobacter mangrovi]
MTPRRSRLPFGRIRRHLDRSAAPVESAAVILSGAVFVVAALVAVVVFSGQYVPISGRGSIGQFVALAGAITAVIVFIAAVTSVRARDPSRSGAWPSGRPSERLGWYDIAAVALAYALIALLGWSAIANVVSDSFQGAVVYSLSAALLAGVAVAVTSYAVFLSAVHLTPMSLSLVLVVFLVAGIFTSMLTASNPLWWQENMSMLGVTGDVSARAFNLTLIIAGVVVTTIAHCATSAIPARTRREQRGRRRVRAGLALIGILLACVGILPVDEFLILHTLAASGMALAFFALVAGLRWLVPALPQTFLVLGYVFVAVILVLAVFYFTGYYTLTAVELVAFVLIFCWLLVLIRNTDAMRTSARVKARVQSQAG